MKNLSTGVLVLFALLISSGALYAQATYSAETNVIYYFTKYVGWPDNGKSGDFVIGVYEDDAMFLELKTGITGRRVGNQRIVISKISELDPGSLRVSILYIGTEDKKLIRRLISFVPDGPVLIVTRLAESSVKGVGMNMKVVNEKINLEIDKVNIESRGLQIASELLAFDKSNQR